MTSFFFNDIAIDLGTANTLIIQKGKIIIDEPSIIALDKNNLNKVIAVGKKAMQMHEKTHHDIVTIRPLKDGVIADFHAAELMIRGMIKLAYQNKRFLFRPLFYRMIICIPSGITDVEKRAVKDSAEHAGAKEVYMIHEPIAAALGIGINITEPKGVMVIDIGGGTTEIAVVALSGIVCNQSIRVAGDLFNDDIVNYIKKKYNLLIGERTAERVKKEVGAVTEELDDIPEASIVRGRDLMTGIPKTVNIQYTEMIEALDKSVSKIEEAILKALESCPPELSGDIYESGIYLTGGGALLKGLDKRISKKTDLKVHVTEEALKSVVRGTGIALENLNTYKNILL